MFQDKVKQFLNSVKQGASNYLQKNIEKPVAGFANTLINATPLANPSVNQGNNFWGNQGGQTLAKVQNRIATATPFTPQFNQQAINNAKTIGNLPIGLGIFGSTTAGPFAMQDNQGRVQNPDTGIMENKPTVRIKDLFQPQSYLGGNAGQYIAGGVNNIMQSVPPTSMGLGQTGKVSLKGVIGGGLTFGGIQAGTNVLSGNPITEGVPQATILGGIVGSTSAKSEKVGKKANPEIKLGTKPSIEVATARFNELIGGVRNEQQTEGALQMLAQGDWRRYTDTKMQEAAKLARYILGTREGAAINAPPIGNITVNVGEVVNKGLEKATQPKGGVKEPWQMTKDEWNSEFDKTLVNFSGTGGEGKGMGRGTKNFNSGQPMQEFLKMGLNDKTIDGMQFPARHPQVIKEALRRGLPVPEEVLREYPDLLAQKQVSDFYAGSMGGNTLKNKQIKSSVGGEGIKVYSGSNPVKTGASVNNKMGSGKYFSEDSNIARSYSGVGGKVEESVINPQKIYDLDQNSADWSARVREEFAKLSKGKNIVEGSPTWSKLRGEAKDIVNKQIQSQGYEGLSLTSNGKKEYNIFSPTQPKGTELKTPTPNILPTPDLPGNGEATVLQLPDQRKTSALLPAEQLLSNPNGPSTKIIAGGTTKTEPTMQEKAAINDFETNVMGKKPSYPDVEAAISNQAPPKNPGVMMDTSKQAADVGSGKAELGIIDTTKKAFADWVNARRATTVEGILKGREFSDLDNKGLQGMLEFQSGEQSGRYTAVKNYFDTKYQALRDAGIKLSYRQDYLPQLWADSPEKIQQVLGRSLTSKPSFTLEAVLKNYQEGIDKGLTPRFSKLSDLVRWYESYSNKAVADHNFFKNLVDENMILPSNKAPKNWVTLNPDRFPKITGRTGTGTYTGDYKAPPEVAQMINNYLNSPDGTLKAIADWVSASKNRMLSFGIPGTGINAHGFNILARSILASPVRGLKSLYYMVNPEAAGRYLNTHMEEAPQAIKYGLSLSSSEYKSLLEEPQGLRSKFGAKWNDLFEKPLFDKMIPALKLEWFKNVFSDYQKSMPQDQAGKEAARFVNDVFGGVNWEELGKNRNWQAVKQITFLAPDWLQTNLNLGKNIGKSVIHPFDPRLTAYRKFAATFLGSYATLNVLNKVLSGHWTWQNDSGNEFNLDTGEYTNDGQKRFIRVYGTAADFARIPSDVMSSLAKGDPSVAGKVVRNRVSTLLQPALTLLTNTDYTGNPVLGKNRYGKPMNLQQNLAGAWTIASPLIGSPSFAQSMLDTATGKKGVEQGMTAAFELPTRYSGGYFSPSNTAIADRAKTEGQSGKQLYDLAKQLKGQKFGDSQMGLIQQEGTGVLQNLLANKNTAKTQTESPATGPVYYYQKGGKAYKVDLTPVEKPQLTGNTEMDKTLISQYNSAVQSQITGITELYKQGKISQNQAIKLVNSLKVSKVSTKKPKNVSFKSIKTKSSPLKLSYPKTKSLTTNVKSVQLKPKLSYSRQANLSFKGKPLSLKKSAKYKTLI